MLETIQVEDEQDATGTARRAAVQGPQQPSPVRQAGQRVGVCQLSKVRLPLDQPTRVPADVVQGQVLPGDQSEDLDDDGGHAGRVETATLKQVVRRRAGHRQDR